MDRKYQVFVSSTYEDLKDARSAVVNKILTKGHIPVGMELFSSGDESQWEVIKRYIALADYYVVIVGKRYGSLDKDGVSFTEKEYDFAVERGIPILRFLLHKEAQVLACSCDAAPKNVSRLNRFLRKLGTHRWVYHWKSPDSLASQFGDALDQLIALNPRTGWVPADQVPAVEALNELTSLVKENRRLREELEGLQEKGEVQLAILAERLREARWAMPFGECGPETKIPLFDAMVLLDGIADDYVEASSAVSAFASRVSQRFGQVSDEAVEAVLDKLRELGLLEIRRVAVPIMEGCADSYITTYWRLSKDGRHILVADARRPLLGEAVAVTQSCTGPREGVGSKGNPGGITE